MDLAKYALLPDSLTPDETRSLFRELMATGEPPNAEEGAALADAMNEVADRHWHTYTLLDGTTRNAVDDWVVHHWDRTSLAKVRALICVIAKLGLTRSAALLRRELQFDMPSPVRNEIDNALREFGSSVEDPYSGIKARPQ